MTHSRYYIGGGVISAVLGVSPLLTPLGAYHTIIGDAPPPSPEQLKFFERRKMVEPFVFFVLENEKGLKLVRKNERYTDPERDYFKAEIDAETDDGRNVEVKSVHQFAGSKWGRDGDPEAVPVHVAAQALWGMPFTGAKQAIAVGQIGWDDCRLYPVYYDEELVVEMRVRADLFWREHVVPRVPPDPTSGQDVIDWVPATEGKMLFADDALANLIREAHQLTREAKEKSDAAEARKNEIRLALLDSTVVVWNGKKLLTWTEQSSRGLNQGRLQAEMPELFERFVETNTSRVMRFK